MKRFVNLLLLTAIAGMMLLPVTLQVNHSLSNRIVADGGTSGNPIPPWPPDGSGLAFLA